MYMSFLRSVIRKLPSLPRMPISPVRSHPSSSIASFVAVGYSKYSCMTLKPRTRISPGSAGATDWPASATMRPPTPGSGRPTGVAAPPRGHHPLRIVVAAHADGARLFGQAVAGFDRLEPSFVAHAPRFVHRDPR